MKHAFKYLLIVLLIFIPACKKDPKVARDKYYQSGQEYLKKSQFEEASIQFRNALKNDQEHIPSFLGLAKCFQQMGDHKNAIAVYQQVARLDSKNLEAKLQLGRYMLGAGIRNPELFRKVQESANEILQQDPSNIEARILLGNAYAGLNDMENSILEMRKALAADPGNISAYLTIGASELRMQQPDKAEQTFKELLEKHPESIEARLAFASFYMAVKKPEVAEAQLKKAFELAPDNPLSIYSLVSFYMSQKREKEAENVFVEAIARKPEAREPRWGLANFQIQRGRVDEAAQILQDLLKKNPRDRQSQLRLAEVYISTKKLDDAANLTAALLKGNKNDPEARFLQAKILVGRGQPDKALAEYDQVLKIKDDLIPAYVDKAGILAARGDLAGAQAVLTAAIEKDRNNPLLHASLSRVLAFTGKYQDALRAAEAVLSALPENQDAKVARAEANRGLGNGLAAEAEFLALAKLDPSNPLYVHRLGLLSIAKKDNAGALAQFRKALELKGDFAPALNDLMVVLVRDKQYDAALKEIDRYSSAFPSKDEMHKMRAGVFLEKGDQATAEAELRKAIDINPANPAPYILLSQMHMNQNSVQQALKDVDQLIAKNDRLAPAHLLRASYLQSAKDDNSAMASYRKVLELDPGSEAGAIAANNLAWILAEKEQNLSEAFTLAQSARKKFPENAEIADTLGWIYYKQKNYTLAVDQLLFSVNTRPKPGPEHYYRLGMAYYQKGDKMLAKQTLRKAVEMNKDFPGSAEAKKILSTLG